MLLHFLKIIGLTLVFFALSWVFYLSREKENFSLVSPVPDFLNLQKNSQVTLLDLWQPFLNSLGNSLQTTTTAKAYLTYDLTSEKTLIEKEPKMRLPMASLTKIMTAIISLEHPRSDDTYTVYGADLVGEDSMGLSTGESLSLEDLLYGLMLPSGNDAAEVLAHNSPFGRTGFVKAMNDKARALGLKDTVFSNPSGLQGDGTQYTTAADLLVITRYALENFPLFTKVVATVEHPIPQTATHKAFDLYNETNLLTTYDGVQGVKTGYTPEAGLCLVTYLVYKEHKIIGIILNSQNRRMEMRELLDQSLTALGIKPPVFRGG